MPPFRYHLRMAPWSRREFLSASLAAGAGLSLRPSDVAGGVSPVGQASARFAPTDRPLRLAVIGIGNRGNDMIKTFAGTGLVSLTAFCDVDLDGPHTKESRDLFPSVPV